MDFAEACRFLEVLGGVPVLENPDRETVAAFCQRNRFHRVQLHLYPQALERLLEGVGAQETLVVSDRLQIRLQIGRTPEGVFLFGPYCSESLSTLDARELLRRCGAAPEQAKNLLVYRSRFPTLSAQKAERLTRSFIALISGSELLPPTRRVEIQPPLANEPEGTERPTADLIAERYAIEREMMQAVCSGNATRAIRLWRQLHQRMEYLKWELGNQLSDGRASAAVTRTVLRVAGMQAGVDPSILDDLTGKAFRENRKATSLDEIEASTERLIRGICRAVRAQRLAAGDYLAETVRYHIDAHYPEELTVAGLAEQFALPESRLIQHFRQYTGQTPGQYLRQVRMRRAAELLLTTHKPVQTIAAEVGIPDANYFVKQFRAVWEKTPTAYRRDRG